MPALVNSSVGSLPGTSELDGTTVWPCWRKNSRKARAARRSSSASTVVAGRSWFEVVVGSGGLRGRPGRGVSPGAKCGADLIRGKPAILQESCLFCTLAEIPRRRAGEPPLRSAARASPVQSTPLASSAAIGLGVEMPRSRKLHADADRPCPACALSGTNCSANRPRPGSRSAASRSTTASTLPAAEPLADQPRGELAAREIAAGQQGQRGRAEPCAHPPSRRPNQASWAASPFAASAARAASPRTRSSRSRIDFSISRAASGCCCRKLRALSLPWPMRSPL